MNKNCSILFVHRTTVYYGAIYNYGHASKSYDRVDKLQGLIAAGDVFPVSNV